MKVNDENSRIWIQDPDPDPLVRSMDPRIRIRIHPKMSWIWNTAVCMLKEEWGAKKRKNKEGAMRVFFLQDIQYYTLTNSLNL